MERPFNSINAMNLNRMEVQWLPMTTPCRDVCCLYPITNEGIFMPSLTVQGIGQFEVTAGKRLVKAMVEDAGTDQLHACGGNSRCTTCRVRFLQGEPSNFTQAEIDTLSARGITEAGIRLSCQIVCDHDMQVELISRFEGSGRKDMGSPVADEMTPPPVWTTR
jgi:ferredoxin